MSRIVLDIKTKNSMPEIKTVRNKNSVKQYLDSIKDPKRKKDCMEIAKIMQELIGEKPAMWGTSLVGFGVVQYTYASGRQRDWLQCGFASRKDSISIYLTCNLDEFEPLLQGLGKYKRGVGCLYIKTLEDVKIPVLKKLIKAALKPVVKK